MATVTEAVHDAMLKRYTPRGKIPTRTSNYLYLEADVNFVKPIKEEEMEEEKHTEILKEWTDPEGVKHRLVWEVSERTEMRRAPSGKVIEYRPEKLHHESFTGRPDALGQKHWRSREYWLGTNSTFELICALLGERD